MGRYGRYILGVLLGLLVGQMLILLPSTVEERTSEDLIPAPTLASNVEQSMQGVHLTGANAGRKEWEMWSDQAISFREREKDAWNLVRVKAIFFADDGVEFLVTGDKGFVDTKSKNLVISGSVVTRSSNGYVLKTDEMNYQSGQRILRSQSAVEMLGPKDESGQGLSVNGGTMTANLLDSTIQINRDVRAEKTVQGNRHVVIRSKSSEFSGNSRAARFLGSVVIDVDSMRITGPRADFNFDRKSDVVKSVLVQGGTKVSDVDKWATSQSVSIYFDEDKYVFQGNPRVVQNDDVLRGEEIVFLDGGRRVQVNKARARVDESRMKEEQ